MIEAKAGDLGLNSSTRNYYILDGRTGAFLTGSDDQKGFESLQTTQNLLTARNSIAGGTDTVGDQSDITANYMDAAIPISGGENAYIIYIYDNRSTVNDLNGKLFLIILQALLVGLLISVLLSFLLSKTMIIPIERLTERAERVAAGEFGSTIAQLVGDIGHELLAHLLVLPLGGDVVHHRHHAAVLPLGDRSQVQLSSDRSCPFKRS